MKHTLFLQKHKTDSEGEIRLQIDGEDVRLTCHWPFDLSSDEWIDVSNSFPLSAYAAAVQRLGQAQEVTVPAVKSGHLALRIESNGSVLLDVDDSSPVRPQRLHDFALEATIADLLPHGER